MGIHTEQYDTYFQHFYRMQNGSLLRTGLAFSAPNLRNYGELGFAVQVTEVTDTDVNQKAREKSVV